MPYGDAGTYSVISPPPRPGDGTTNLVPITNYLLSFGDNFAVLPLSGPNPWETPPGQVPPNPQIGWDGFWGTTTNGGSMRGFADYKNGQWTNIAGVTDDTSNTILVGEGLPAEDPNNEMRGFTGTACEATIPLNWSNARRPPLCGGYGSTDWNCAFSYAASGFKSRHPGGANLLFADGSVKFVKNSTSRVTYAAIDSKAGGEAVSADQYQ